MPAKSTQIISVPRTCVRWYVAENKEVPDRNIGIIPLVRKYANYRTLHIVKFPHHTQNKIYIKNLLQIVTCNPQHATAFIMEAL